MGTNDKPHLLANLLIGAGGNGEVEMDRVAYYVSDVCNAATKGG
ncbi:hypothetical protein BJ928_1011332 [Rhizobium sp. WW_1]|jgi:hypothetical protein|nr:hypothetical protein BJ928_1011332 [Rhizobium sp. WW_1]